MQSTCRDPLSLSPFSHPAVHPDQTPELCYQKRVAENPAAFEYEDIWQETDIPLDLSCNRMSRLILLVSLCLLPGIFEGLKQKRLTLASF